MPQSGEIDLNEAKAKYSVDDIILVDKGALDLANETRLYYEIGFAIGLTLLGVILSKFDWSLAITMVIFLGFGIFNLIRYLMKYKQLNKK